MQALHQLLIDHLSRGKRKRAREAIATRIAELERERTALDAVLEDLTAAIDGDARPAEGGDDDAADDSEPEVA